MTVKKIMVHGRDIILLAAMLLIWMVSFELSDLFIKTEEYKNQSTNGFPEGTIEFMIINTEMIDFSFLNGIRGYALASKLNPYESIYVIKNTEGLFSLKESEHYFSKDEITYQDYIYICGSRGGEIYKTDPFCYGDIVAEEYDTYFYPDNPGMEYMIFLCNNDYNSLTNDRFILFGEEKAIHNVLEKVKEHVGPENVEVLNVSTSLIGHHTEIDEEALYLLLVSLLLIISGLVMIIYWWSLQYDDLKKAALYLGIRNSRMIMIRDFLVIISASDVIAVTINFKALCAGSMIVVAVGNILAMSVLFISSGREWRI